MGRPMRSRTRTGTTDTDVWTSILHLGIMIAALALGLALVVFPRPPQSAEPKAYFLVWYTPKGQDSPVSSGAQDQYIDLKDCEAALLSITGDQERRFQCATMR